MSRRRRRKFSRDPFEAGVEDLSHDGRGVATHEEKKVFIHGALPGERVMARLTDRKRHFDEGEALEILEASPDRIEPECPHFGQCGGCSLQHLDPARQIGLAICPIRSLSHIQTNDAGESLIRIHPLFNRPGTPRQDWSTISTPVRARFRSRSRSPESAVTFSEIPTRQARTRSTLDGPRK